MLIRAGELASGDIAAHFDITRPAISQHLQVLTAAGLVSVRKDGTRRLYQARPEGLADLRAFLEIVLGLPAPAPEAGGRSGRTEASAR